MDPRNTDSGARTFLGSFAGACFALYLGVAVLIEQRKPGSLWSWLFLLFCVSMIIFKVFRDWAFALGWRKSKRETDNVFAASGTTMAVLFTVFTYAASFRFAPGTAIRGYSSAILVSGAVYVYPEFRDWLRAGLRDPPPPP